jgi:hypothetical protein
MGKSTPTPWTQAGTRIFQGNTANIIASDMTNPADRLIVCASPLMLDTLKTVHAQLIDWGKRNGMDFKLIDEVEAAITAAEPGWRPK